MGIVSSQRSVLMSVGQMQLSVTQEKPHQLHVGASSLTDFVRGTNENESDNRPRGICVLCMLSEVHTLSPKQPSKLCLSEASVKISCAHM